MKKLFTLALCAIMALSMIACSNQTPKKDETTPPMIGGDSAVQIPNPFTDCDDMASAEKLAGFSFTLPTDFEATSIRVVDGEMMEVIFVTDGNEICIRKAIGNENISGNYNEHTQSSEVEVGDIMIETKGNDDFVNVATWTNGKYTYSISATNGLSSEEIVSFVNEIK